MSLTTTGHVDIIQSEGSVQQGELWEYAFAILVVFASTILFIYVNANCTSAG